MSDSAIQGTRKAIKEMADGTLRIQIDIEPRDKRQFHELFPEIDMPVAVAPLVPVAEGIKHAMGNNGNVAHKYGQQAKELRLSSFFRRPGVWRAVGADQEFLDWIKTQPCEVMSAQCNGDIVPMHVRRVANGAGTGVKPPYSAIPGCHFHHSLQHQQGESAIYPREWWDKKRIEYLVKWCWWSLKGQLGYDSWSEVPPEVLSEWAFEHNVAGKDGGMWLPRSYYDRYPDQP